MQSFLANFMSIFKVWTLRDKPAFNYTALIVFRYDWSLLISDDVVCPMNGFSYQSLLILHVTLSLLCSVKILN